MIDTASCAPVRVDRVFGERFLSSIDDFYAYGVDKLFNDWWAQAPADAVAKYVQALEGHPEHGPLVAEAWLAEPLTLTSLQVYGPGSLGQAYLRFMVDNQLVERLAAGYREYHEALVREGRLDRLPPALAYKVLRGFQTHDLHHVLTGYPATAFGELALQAFQLAQLDYPYAAMWIAVITGHMALVDPWMIRPAMDAITDGWAFGRRARSLQFLKFEHMLARPLQEVRAEFGLVRTDMPDLQTPAERTPDRLRGG